MLQITRPETETKEYAYRRIFQADYECHGFHCDDNGDPVFRGIAEERLFYKCLEKPNKYKDCGRVLRVSTTISPALAKCECGHTLELKRNWHGKPNKCACGRLYTASGTEIAKGEAYEVCNH